MSINAMNGHKINRQASSEEDGHLQLLLTGGSSELAIKIAGSLTSSEGKVKAILSMRRQSSRELVPKSRAITVVGGIDLCVQSDLDALREYVLANTSGVFNVVHCAGHFS